MKKMRIVIGCDHAGFELKRWVQKRVRALGYSIVDVGSRRLKPGDDYPDYAKAMAEVIQKGKAKRGILICGSGVGASIAINKFKGIRAALCENTFSAHQGVEDDDANVLCLGARVTGPELAMELVDAFLHAHFSNADRHRRRVQKVISFER